MCGLVVALAGCLRGLQSGYSSSAVGDAATSAVVAGTVVITVADGVFAVVFDLLGIQRIEMCAGGIGARHGTQAPALRSCPTREGTENP